MAGTHQNQRRVVSFITNGKRANDRYDLSTHVGAIVRRSDDATKKAVASTARKVVPLANQTITSRYNIPQSYLANRVKVRIDPDTLHVDASQLKFPLSVFSGRWGGRSSSGATASIQLAVTRTYSGTFIAPGRFRGQSMPLIYARVRGKKVKQKAGRYAGKMREPIISLRGPSTYQMILGRIATDDRGNDISVDNGAASASLKTQLISYVISERRRLYDVERKANG